MQRAQPGGSGPPAGDSAGAASGQSQNGGWWGASSGADGTTEESAGPSSNDLGGSPPRDPGARDVTGAPGDGPQGARRRKLWSRRPLRARLATLAALTVALAVAASAAASWFLVRAQLVNSLDDSLRTTAVTPQSVVDQVRSGRCSASDAAPNPFGATVQAVDTSGRRCLLVGERIDVTSADTEVARGRTTETLHDARGRNGTDYRVRTTPVPGTNLAVSLARPLTETDESMNRLAIFLAVVGGAGVLAAAGAGVVLARAGLRPVDRLTQTVEHVARTEDLTVRIPVDGDDEVARLSRSFNAMTEALATSRELQRQLIADAGHELRTPLTSMRTNIELLARSEERGRPLPPEDRRELLDSLTTQMTELNALIGDLRELAAPAGAQGWRAEVVALHDIVQRAIDRVRPRATSVTIYARLEPWFVWAEPSGLERSLVNLLDNAVKFSPPEGAVQVSLADGTLRVRDEGVGVSGAELPYVFDRFWRSPSARSMPGSGLGLSIVKRAVEQADGEVWLHSPADGGTEAVVRLPGTTEPPPPPEGDDGRGGHPLPRGPESP